MKLRHNLAIALLAAPLALYTMAAEAATIDLSPLITSAGDYIATIAVTVAAAIVGLVARAAQKWIGIDIDAKNREALHAAIHRGVNSVMESLMSRAKEGAIVEVDNELVAMVANYVASHSPGTLKHFGLTPMALENLIRAHFGGLLLEGGLTDIAETPA